MTEPQDTPNLDDMIDPHEEPHPDHREHAKASGHPDDDALARRTDQERAAVEHDRTSGQDG